MDKKIYFDLIGDLCVLHEIPLSHNISDSAWSFIFSDK